MLSTDFVELIAEYHVDALRLFSPDRSILDDIENGQHSRKRIHSEDLGKGSNQEPKLNR